MIFSVTRFFHCFRYTLILTRDALSRGVGSHAENDFGRIFRIFARFRAFSKGKNSAPRAPPTSSLAPLESAWTKLSNGARFVVGGARGATCEEFETRKKWRLILPRFRQKHEKFRKNHPGSPGFFRWAFFLGSWRCYFNRDIIEKWKCVLNTCGTGRRRNQR